MLLQKQHLRTTGGCAWHSLFWEVGLTLKKTASLGSLTMGAQDALELQLWLPHTVVNSGAVSNASDMLILVCSSLCFQGSFQMLHFRCGALICRKQGYSLKASLLQLQADVIS